MTHRDYTSVPGCIGFNNTLRAVILLHILCSWIRRFFSPLRLLPRDWLSGYNFTSVLHIFFYRCSNTIIVTFCHNFCPKPAVGRRAMIYAVTERTLCTIKMSRNKIKLNKKKKWWKIWTGQQCECWRPSHILLISRWTVNMLQVVRRRRSQWE